jgi:AmmeMemoRadiSam system protein B
MPFTHRVVGAAGKAVRAPAVAGQFYPDDPATLRTTIDRMLEAVPVSSDELAAAYVVPHAGYRYSGATAAHVYARLRAHAGDIARVVIVGPAHRVPVKGCVISGAATWRTPLGEIPVDDLAAALAGDGHGVLDDRPHEPEHSIEVQLPFLQRALGAVPVVPIVVGSCPADDVVVTLLSALELASSPGTVVLCSTDLSHYEPDEEARRQDRRTIQAVLDLAPERIGVRDACGVFALRGVVGWARHAGLTPRLLHHATSAETTGDPSRVVGYPAMSFSRPPSVPSMRKQVDAAP